MMIPVNNFLEEVEGAVRVAELVMKLGEVERATRHPDGRHETDTTHTVMLALVAGRLADVHNDGLDFTDWDNVDHYLDPERVLRFALVHDLVEALAGDVNTIRPLTPAERAEKDNREVDALVEISEDIPWLGEAIQAYEEQSSIEARFVRHLDKCMPKLTYIHNGCRTVREADMSREELEASLRAQGNRLAAASPDLPLAVEFFSATSALCLSAYEDEPGSPLGVVTVKAADILELGKRGLDLMAGGTDAWLPGIDANAADRWWFDVKVAAGIEDPRADGDQVDSLGYVVGIDHAGKPPEVQVYKLPETRVPSTEAPFFSWSRSDGFGWHDSRQAARDSALQTIDWCRQYAELNDEWDEEVETVRWGQVFERARLEPVLECEDGLPCVDAVLAPVGHDPAPTLETDRDARLQTHTSAGMSVRLTRRVLGADEGETTWDAARRVVAEVEDLRAYQGPNPVSRHVREVVPHFTRTDADLLKRAIIYGSAHYTGKPRWGAVAKLFGVGSTVAHHMCVFAGIDPDQVGEPDPAEVSS